jgi:uncharacterized protein YndB with AHSA1/START domain
MPETTTHETPEFVLTRTFDAPRDLVWKAYTEADRLAQWWGPKGFTMKSATVDLKPGGSFLYGMTGPNGIEMWGKFVYQEINAPERLAFIVSFCDEHGNVARNPYSAEWPLEVMNSVDFSEQAGKTTLTMRAWPHNASAVEVEAFRDAREQVTAGTNATLDQLVEYLATA